MAQQDEKKTGFRDAAAVVGTGAIAAGGTWYGAHKYGGDAAKNMQAALLKSSEFTKTLPEIKNKAAFEEGIRREYSVANKHGKIVGQSGNFKMGDAGKHMHMHKTYTNRAAHLDKKIADGVSKGMSGDKLEVLRGRQAATAGLAEGAKRSKWAHLGKKWIAPAIGVATVAGGALAYSKGNKDK